MNWSTARQLPRLGAGLLLALVALLGARPSAAAEQRPATDLLLPYFEVDLERADAPVRSRRTTLFAVGNAAAEPVNARVAVHTNWGIPVLEVNVTLNPDQVRTFNLRDWIVGGAVPGRVLAAEEQAHLRAALAGQRSPRDQLFYASEIEPHLAIGSVTIRTQGARQAALWGDYFVVDPDGNSAQGDSLVDISSRGCAGLCRRHAVRYLLGGGFDGGTEILVWTSRRNVPSADVEYLATSRIEVDARALDEPGRDLGSRLLHLLPLEVIRVADLELAEPFGWLDLTSETDAFVAVRHTADGRYSVLTPATCLPERTSSPGPAIRLRKSTNGEDANLPPGPSIPVGQAVSWEYLVTNTGEVHLTDVAVTDDQGVAVSCPQTALAPGESMSCTGSGVAQACQYANLGTVYGVAPDGTVVNDSDPSHYFGTQNAAISIEKSTNGQDADTAPGPKLPVGSAVAWTYLVKNTGDVALSGVVVSDDQGVAVSCPKTSLAPGESMTCTGAGTAVAGQYKNVGTAKGTPATCGGAVSASDPSHYYGENPPEPPGIKVKKLTNGEDANVPPGPSIPVGAPVTWTYVVTNTGAVVLSNIHVTDDQGVAVSCPKTTLQPGESMTCTGYGIAQACQYKNVGKATGTSPAGVYLSATDPSHYFGKTYPAISIKKSTNGHDANEAPGPKLPVGSAVAWTYLVKNTGDVALGGVVVSDDQGVAVSCPKTSLAPGESMTCTGAGTAVAGQYKNVGTAKGTSTCGEKVSASDPSHYYGENPPEPPGLRIEKLTNGEDADVPPGPSIPVGAPVTWTYIVTNTGGVTLTGVHVTDDQGVAVSCPKTTLQPGESMTCTGYGVAKACQYKNVGKAAGTTPAGDYLSATDPSHYFGKTYPAISIKKSTNGHDANEAPGPKLPVGSAVTWSYVVKNTGDVALSGVVVSDDQGVAVSCPKTSLAPGESMTCTGAGTAVAGQYKNVGTAKGTSTCGEKVSASDPSHYYGELPPPPPPPGDEGCTPGYWKNHQDSWPATGWSTQQTVGSVFSAAGAFPSLAAASLHEALGFSGGSSVEGGARILLRAAVAALLNASHPGVDYPHAAAQVIADVNAALASGNRDAMIALAAALDADNNLGCPLN